MLEMQICSAEDSVKERELKMAALAIYYGFFFVLDLKCSWDKSSTAIGTQYNDCLSLDSKELNFFVRNFENGYIL